MRTFFRATCAILLAAAVTNCAQLKEKLMGAAEDSGAAADTAEPTTETEGSEATEESTVATEEAPAPKASNENDIARFPDETKLDNVAATTERQQSVREVPTTGKIIATLSKGTRVTEIAQRDKYFLIVFDDPKSSSTKLMGWIHQDAFTAVAVTDAGDATDAGAVADAGAALKCAAGETQLFGDAPFCGKTCAKDADCASGQVCKGTAHKYTNGKQGDIVPVCTLQVTHDAGATAPTDAGTTASDAGAKAPTDAGATFRPVIKLPTFDGGTLKLRPKLGGSN